MAEADPQHLDGLIQAHLAGRLDAAATVELRSWLAAGRENRIAFARAVRFHEELIQVATDQARQRGAGASAQFAGVGRSARRRRTNGVAPGWWRRRVLPAALAAAAILVLGIGMWWRANDALPRPTPVTLASGTALDDAGASVLAGAQLPVGTRLTLTTAGGLRWSDGSQVVVSAATQVACRESGVDITSGELRAEVQPRQPGQPFTVATAHALVTVVGTRFRVAVAAGTTAVEVESGHVRVASRQGGERMLGPGESVHASAGGLRGRTLAVAADGAGAPAGAFASMAAACAAARPGDTILLEPGRHFAGAKAGSDAALVINRSGEPGNPVIVRGLPGAELASDAWNAIRIENSAWIELRGLRLVYQGSERSGMSGNGIAVTGSQHVTIADCTIVGFGGDGVNAKQSDHLAIIGNRIEECGGGRLGVMGGVTVRPASTTDHAPGYHVRVIGNRILRSTVNAPNHQTPDRWTGGHGILFYSDAESPVTQRSLIADNLIAGSGGSGISIYLADGVDVRTNIIHCSGRQPKHPGGEVHIYAKACSASGNIIVPSVGRHVWVLRSQDPVSRSGNLVWERDGIQRPEVLPEERSPDSPFLVPAADEPMRSDFRLRSELHAGPQDGEPVR